MTYTQVIYLYHRELSSFTVYDSRDVPSDRKCIRNIVWSIVSYWDIVLRGEIMYFAWYHRHKIHNSQSTTKGAYLRLSTSQVYFPDV